MAPMTESERIEEIARKYRELFGQEAAWIVRAPGRVNLIGEHTDYNDGFVFPAAIDYDTIIAGAARPDRQVRAHALNFNQSSTFGLDGLQPATEGRERWSNYVRAMAYVLEGAGMRLSGLNCVIQGTVPIAAGLSSSAAMQISSGLAFCAASGIEIDLMRLAFLAQKAEHEFNGVKVGIMDQFISALGQKDHALFIDTRPVAPHVLNYEAVPLPMSGVSIVIADTNKKRGLVDSEYNTRRAECERAVEILRQFLPGITALRDVSLGQFDEYADRLPEITRKRARHVIMEDARTMESVAALKAGDISRFGVLMNESHDSLKNDYEVSCKELDSLVAAAQKVDGVYGARMTGAGFGGCTVSLVADEAVERFRQEVPGNYKAATGLNTTIYVTTAAQGAQRLR